MNIKKYYWIIGVILILGIILIGFYFLNFESDGREIFCPDYDNNEQECLFHKKCKWVSGRGDCDPIGGMDEEDEDVVEYDNNNNDEAFDDKAWLNQELELIVVPDNLSNELCKKIPLSNQEPYSERYRCLALVNHDERFCEGIDEEKEKLMCLAFTKEDSSFCEKVEGKEPKHVCYLQLSVATKNIKFCDDVNYLDTIEKNENEKLGCYMNYITNLYAWGKSDEIKAEYCNEFPADWEDRDTCFALKSRDVSFCNNVANCLTFFEQDISFCNKHTELPCCIKDRAKTSRDVSICELLPQPGRDNCVGSYCTHTELDVNICDTIIDIKERQDRYLELAMNLANW